MPVQIEFRGVMLFNCKKATDDTLTLTNILIPDGEDDLGKWKSSSGKHPDGSDARVHYAGLVVEKEGHLEVTHLPLKDTTVTITSTDTGPTTIQLSGLPKLRPATFDNSKKVHKDLATARVTIAAPGALTPIDLPEKIKSEKFLTSSVTDHGAKFTTGNATITVETTTHGKKVFPLTGEDRAGIYNYEVRYPSIADLKAVGHCQPNMMHDDDFKWLYSLVVGWDKTNDLLAPRVGCDARYVTVFTCFPAVWEE